MQKFISAVLDSLSNKGYSFSEITFILPSKRAILFLKNELSTYLDTPIFSPEIFSIEEFIETLSQLKSISNTELIFKLYQAYTRAIPEEEIEPFDSFYKWGQTLLQDFNEIDRHLVKPDVLFEYLHAVKEINHWSVGENKTSLIETYLSFWKQLPALYYAFKEDLLNEGLGYQGLIYRESVENIELFVQNNADKKFIFLGFNALNKAEETVIQELLANQMAEVFWDIDASFFNNKNHEVGFFIRKYARSWPYYKNHPFNDIHNLYTQEKNINVYGIPKNVGQAKHVGELLKQLAKAKNKMSHTAVILADETLLMPVLNSIPENIGEVNITMGFPLQYTPVVRVFEQFFHLHKKKEDRLYYKDVVELLGNPFIKPLYFHDYDLATEIIETIEKENLIYLSVEKLKSLSQKANPILTDLLFSPKNQSPKNILTSCFTLVSLLKSSLEKTKAKNLLNLEYVYKIHCLLLELERINTTYNFITDIATLHSFFKELTQKETLDFKGEPLKGIQIMGVLESRAIDFETVIITSVNEGILPAGKTQSSFIPYDLKLQHGLPTYREKDAVYAYHFYRLLQRAKNIHILYNTEVDVLNTGEKSRFITQLEIEGIHTLHHTLVVPGITSKEAPLKVIKKNPAIITSLMEIAKKGFSPSSLTSYIRNPIDFYNKKVLGMTEYDEAEETVAANTLGTVVHNVLESLYLPFAGKILTPEAIQKMKPKIAGLVTSNFSEVYKSGDITKGKNRIVFEIAKRYVHNFLAREIHELNSGNEIKLIGVELNVTTEIPIPGLDFPVTLTGKIDRVDLFNGIPRIIDYKTGKVEQKQVEVIDWEAITSDYTQYSKSFQVLMYALMLSNETLITPPFEAGIVSFKNLNSGFIKFIKKESSERNANKDTIVTTKTLACFQKELSKLIREIFEVTIPFTEKEV